MAITKRSITPEQAGLLLLSPYEANGVRHPGHDRAVAALVDAGLLERDPTAEDRVRITPDGEELLQDLLDAHDTGDDGDEDES